MRITSIEIKKFRSITDLQFSSGPLTVICGPNSCGKSNVLRALKLAFMAHHDPEKVGLNLSNTANSPNEVARVKLTFDSPNSRLRQDLDLKAAEPFTYLVQFKRNGKLDAYLNGVLLTTERRFLFLQSILVVHVPPIRDLSAGGLDPFREALAAVIRKARGPTSLNNLNNAFKQAIVANGQNYLLPAQATAKTILNVDNLLIDADALNLNLLLPLAGIKFKVNQRTLSLDKLGTGHQSSVILSLYRQLGTSSGKYVLYLFEEPDNHLHPTSLTAIADDLKSCATGDTQSFITTHSPYLLNQFPISSVLALQSKKDRTTALRPRNLQRTDYQIRVALGKYGLRPAEALLSRKVVIVEGANDVITLRTLIECYDGISAERQDVLIVAAGGKEPALDLCSLLQELGANWFAFVDWDATHDTRSPAFKSVVTAQKRADHLIELTNILSSLSSVGNKKTTAQKAVDSLINELSQPIAPFTPDFSHSALGKHLLKSKALNTASFSKLKAAVKSKRKRVIRSLLQPVGIQLWSDTPEALLLGTPQAEDIIESLLMQHGKLKQPPALAVRRTTLANKLHKLAHEPELLEEMVRSLWAADELSGVEFRDAVKMATD
ncbi:AAA domain-containing protein, putative AbiEii toxin, Type IV TA system [Variovorax sp. OK605]|uniref:ATP-dependent nuclease n=1 Tax=Variovorax sp. OK605 TaxID=1855317 RepID=UPI0008E59AFF|nr:AAA family ATPase [Variovorax sp. OK605]SFP46612.1 AAA domain-containing protein, putative AbiEii toxin, Type IV TA system [Variovorax sp. OK605]